MDHVCKNSEWTIKTGNWLIFLQDHLTMNASLHFIDDNPSTSDDIHTYNTNIRKNSIMSRTLCLSSVRVEVVSEVKPVVLRWWCLVTRPTQQSLHPTLRRNTQWCSQHPHRTYEGPRRGMISICDLTDPWRLYFKSLFLWSPIQWNGLQKACIINWFEKTPAIRPFFRSTSPTCQCWSKD